MKKTDKYILLGICLLLIVSIYGRPIHKIDLSNVDIPYELAILADSHSYNKTYVKKN